MTLGIINYLTGWHTVKISSESKEAVLSLMLCDEYIYWDLRRNEDCSISFKLLKRDINKFILSCQRHGVNYYIEQVSGWPRLLKKYKKRVGLLIGLCIFILSLWVSTFFIWEISVVGNEKISETDIFAQLEASGCKIGTYIPSIDFDRLHNAFLMNSDNIAWISVNMRGTVANVEVREILKKDKHQEGNQADYNFGNYANIIADNDGQIELVDTYEGRCVVNIGDTVQKGDLLISGVLDNERIGLRYKYASGKVLARVNKEIIVEVPKQYDKKMYTGVSKSYNTIKIFGKSINLSLNSGNLGATYDKIIREEPLTFFGTISLPAIMVSEIYNEYTIQTVTLEENEMVDIALKEFRIKLDAALENAELLERTVISSHSDDVYRIECILYCLEDIALEKSFEISVGE